MGKKKRPAKARLKGIARGKGNKKSISLQSKKKSEMPNYVLSMLNSPICIFDFRTEKISYSNEKFRQFAGLTVEECNRLTLPEFYSWIEASDLKILAGGVRARMEQLYPKLVRNASAQLSFTVNFRFNARNGRYTHVLSQCTVIEWNKNLFPAAILNLHTDVTDYKKDQKIILSVSMYDEEMQQWKVVHTEEFLHVPERLSKREIEIMKLLVSHKSLEKISEMLNISYNTVRTHCQNILNQTGCTSQNELKEMAVKEGWV